MNRNNDFDNLNSRAFVLASRLRAATRKIAEYQFLGSFKQGDEALLDLSVIRYLSFPHFGEIVGELDTVLNRMGKDVNPQYRLSEGEFWSVGSISIHYPVRAIYGGFIEPVLRQPILPDVPLSVVAFLIKLPDAGDYLDREHHDHIGFHYHYLDRRKRRSNRVLCWDTHAAFDAKTKEHPFFQETHGEGRAKFSARPEQWGETKRKSMHDACFPDFDDRSLNQFRCASAKSASVWPTNAVLTIIPRAAPSSPKHRSKKLHGSRRR